MDGTKNAAALVLNRRPYRENDSLVTVYTDKFGKLNLVARGTKKLHSKLAGHLEPISLVSIMIIGGKGFDYIGAALGDNAYLGIKEDLNKLYYAGRAIAWFDKLVKENQPDERLFLLICRWLESLDNYRMADFSKESGELFFSGFSLKLMIELGYEPEMHYCLDCRQKIAAGKNYFDLLNGGLVCNNCFLAKKKAFPVNFPYLLTISDNCVKIVRFLMEDSQNKAEKLKIDKKLIKELSILTVNFLNYHI